MSQPGELGRPGTGGQVLPDSDQLDRLPDHLFGCDLAHLFDYCRALLGQDAEAARIARSVLGSAHALVGSDRLRASLFALGRRQALALRPPSGEGPSYVPLALIADSSQQTDNGVLRAFRALSDRDREILDLIYRHGIRPADLPAVLGVPAEEGYRCLVNAEEEFISLAAGPGAIPGAGMEDIAALPLAALPTAEGQCQLGRSGEPPVTAEPAVGLADRHVHDDPRPPSARQPRAPAQLPGIAARLLAKDPAARPASAAAARAGMRAALNPGAAPALATSRDDVAPSGLSRRRFRRLSRAEVALAGALAAALVALVAVLLSGGTGYAAPSAAPSVPPSANHPAPVSRKAYKPARLPPAPKLPARPAPTQPGRAAPRQPARPGPTRSARPGPTRSARPGPTRSAVPPADALPPVAAAAATFVGDLEAGVTDGQVAPPAGQDLYNHLQHLLFGPPNQTAQQIQQQYEPLLQSYDKHRQQRQITGHAAIALRRALRDLAAAVGAG